MNYRSLPLAAARSIEIRTAADVRVIGIDLLTIQASIQGDWGLNLERIGDVIRVLLGGNGEVRVPHSLSVQVYAGRSADIEGLSGMVQAYTGGAMSLNAEACTLLQSSAGGAMTVKCARLGPDLARVSAGRDLRWQVAEMNDIRLGAHDIGGRWEITFGLGSRCLHLISGGDVVVVTAQSHRVTSPNGIIGLVEAPVPPAMVS